MWSVVAYGAAFLLAVVAGLGLSRPLFGCSIGTMATSGTVAFAAPATVALSIAPDDAIPSPTDRRRA